MNNARQAAQVHLQEVDVGFGKFVLDILDGREGLGLGSRAHVNLGTMTGQSGYCRFAAAKNSSGSVIGCSTYNSSTGRLTCRRYRR